VPGLLEVLSAADRQTTRRAGAYLADPLLSRTPLRGAGAFVRPVGGGDVRAFPSWSLRIECDRCGKPVMHNEVHAPVRQCDMPIRVRPVRRIVLMS
jgi:hypothetical protein